MEDFEAKWRADCDTMRNAMKETLRKTKTISEADRMKISIIGGLGSYIDYYRKNYGYPPEELLAFYDGKSIINTAIWEHKEKLKKYETTKASDRANEERFYIQILETYRDSF